MFKNAGSGFFCSIDPLTAMNSYRNVASGTLGGVVIDKGNLGSGG